MLVDLKNTHEFGRKARTDYCSLTERSFPVTNRDRAGFGVPNIDLDRLLDIVLSPRRERVTLIPTKRGLEVKREPLPSKDQE